MLPPFWSIPSLFLAGASVAVGLAIINSCNSLGSFMAGYISGYLQSISSFAVLVYLGVCYIIGLALLLTLPLKEAKESRE